MTELRKPYPGNPLYLVTAEGRVWGPGAGRYAAERPGAKLLRVYTDKYGYPFVRIKLRCRYRQVKVHRMVLETFVGPCPDGMECCHADGNPANPRLENLRWDTSSANKIDRLPDAPGDKRPRGVKLCAEDVRAIRESDARTCDLAHAYDVAVCTIQRARSGSQWAHV